MEFEKVRDIIVETLGCDAEAVTPTASLADDLGADSLAAVELVMALEEAAGISIAEEDAGLHFLLRLDGAPSDETLRREAEQRGIRLAMLSDYYQRPQDAPQHVLVVNYTGIDLDRLPAALERLAALWKENDHV